eukprot:scaffold3821_cov173-Amphora_coffeaeformis.AAC.19
MLRSKVIITMMMPIQRHRRALVKKQFVIVIDYWPRRIRLIPKRDAIRRNNARFVYKPAKTRRPKHTRPMYKIWLRNCKTRQQKIAKMKCRKPTFEDDKKQRRDATSN